MRRRPPVYDVFAVQVLEHQRHLRRVELGLFVVQVPDAPQIVEQLAAGDEVEVEDEVLVVLRNSMHLDLRQPRLPGTGGR